MDNMNFVNVTSVPVNGLNLGVLLNYILSQYFAQLYCTNILWRSSLSSSSSSSSSSSLSALLPSDNVGTLNYGQTNNFGAGIKANNNGNESYIQLIWLNYDKSDINEQNFIQQGVDSGCQGWIIENDAIQLFLDNYQQVVDISNQRPKNIHLVFLLSHPNMGVDLWDNENITNILEHRTLEDIPNILVIIPSSNTGNSVDLITSQFVGRFNITSPIFLDRFYAGNNSFKYNTNLFPDKLTNLQQRNLKLALFNYKPYTTVQHVPSGTGNANAMNTEEEKTLLIDGTETLMFLEYCLKHNCTLLISEDEDGQWGTIFENRTGNGLTGAVVERRAEVGVGALYIWYYESGFLTLSAVISRTGITCIVPKPRLLANFLMPILPFSTKLWIAVLVSVIVGVITIRVVENYRHVVTTQPWGNNENFQSIKHSIATTIIDVTGIYVLQPIYNMADKLAERSIFGCLLLSGWLIANTYSCGLASLMTIPLYEASIDNRQQLADRNLEWAATHDAWIFSIQSATQPVLVKLVKHFQTHPFEYLHKRSVTSDLAFSIERLQYGHYAIGEYIGEDALDHLQLMAEDIYWEYTVAMSYRTWSLSLTFDDLVMRVAETGIQKYWEIMVVPKHLNNNVQIGVRSSRTKHHENRGPVKLTPSHLLGIFIVWLLGLTASTLVFFIEILWHRHQNKISITSSVTQNFYEKEKPILEPLS